MKKYATIILAAALVFAFVGQASATALETSGEYRGRYWYLSNYNYAGLAAGTVEKNNEFWDQRLRLGMTWKVTDTVKVGARADILENVWQTIGSDASEIDFDWAYAAFNWGMATLTIGKQDVSWGPGVYAKVDNRYRAKIGGKFDKIAASVAWDKMTETFDSKAADDDNGFSAGVVFPAADWSLGVLGVYRLNEATPGVKNTIYGIDGYFTGAAGGAKLSGEIAYATGDIKAAGLKTDQSGLMAYLGAFMPLGPVNAGVELGYSKGDKPGGDKTDALFHDYNGPFNSFILFNNFDLDGWNSVYSGGADKGLNNALAVKASGTFAASKELSLMVAGVWAKADEKGVRASDDMGIEVDGLAKYAITENVAVVAGLGWLSAGDYFGKNVDDPLVATFHAYVTF